MKHGYEAAVPRADGDGCAANCLSDESCGNGIRDADAGEVCDDSNTTGGDGCSADCLSDESCGNSIVDTAAGEACDDGNTSDNDGCNSACLAETCGDALVLEHNGDLYSCDHYVFPEFRLGNIHESLTLQYRQGVRTRNITPIS